MKIKCPYCKTSCTAKSGTRSIRQSSRYQRKSDGQWVRRYLCKPCQKTFSSATLSPLKWQKKRHRNEVIRRVLCGGMSQREAARTLNLNRKTIVRKFLFLAQQCEKKLRKRNETLPKAIEVEFDDLETFEHTKCKPLSVTLMVEYKTRRILDLEVAQMPAKGRLAHVSRKKYGLREDMRPQSRERLFERVSSLIYPQATIRSDSNPHYPSDVKKYFPLSTYITVMGGRGASTGQGELKKLRFDPIFSLNHTCAMMRANINRLFRKTWCTTKKPDRLRAHLMLYAHSHNERIFETG